MEKILAKVESVNLGSKDDLGKEPCAFLQAELDGFVGDRHRSFSRQAWAGDKQAEGTKRRNERQWSVVSVEELAEIQQTMDLKEPLTAASLGANICLVGVPHLSRLPKGTTLIFPSGAELEVMEYNTPCLEMGQKLSKIYTTSSGQPVRDTAFSKAAKYCRGVVGVVEVAGIINAGDDVTIKLYAPPKWITRLSKTESPLN
ncbi:MAG: MOSC domain-containing protein [Sphingomonadales bacterium]